MVTLKKISTKFLWCMLLFLIGHTILPIDAIGGIADCPDGVLGFWKLEETSPGSYQDAINTNNGTCSGPECPGDVNGTIGNGQGFNGNNEIIISAGDTINWAAGQSFTIELWMRRDTGSIAAGFEAFIGRADAGGLNWYLGINSSGNAQAQLTASNGNGPGVLTVSKDLRSNPADPNGSTWHHVALVRNGSSNTTTIYVDSEMSASQNHTYTAGFDSATAPMTFGALDGGNNLSNGALDEVAIYGRALSQDEIRQHYYIARDYCSLYDSAIQIMPMGDSITKGVWDNSNPPENEMIAYRLDLSSLLESNLYLYDFVGSENNGKGIDPDFDDAHAGFPGITDDQLFTLLNTGVNTQPETVVQVTPGPYLDTHPTEVILLHIGTNQPDTSTTAVANILDEIDDFSKNITVVLARIINQNPNNGTITAFNNAIDGLVSTRIGQGDKIIRVDMESGAGLSYVFDTTSPYNDGDLFNTFHPNPSGYNKLAGQWFATLETILPQSEIPAITSTGITDAAKDEPYTYTVIATGPPSPTFELTVNPAPGEMTIDEVSGLIEWTPDTVGDFEVTVQANNWTGNDTQTFTISVNAIPQAMGDAYNGIMEGDTLTVSASQGVLNNDTDENDPLSAVLVGDVSYGTLNLNADGSLTYTHDGSDNFNDSFSYVATDGKAQSEAATVTLTIIPVDDPPSSSGGGGGGGGCFITTVF